MKKQKLLKSVVIFIVVGLLFSLKGCHIAESQEEEKEGATINLAPENLVSIEELPEWIQDEIETIMAGPDAAFLLQVFKGEWKNQIIYLIYDAHQSCFSCDSRYENGEKIGGIVDCKKWTLIYRCGRITTESFFVPDRREIAER